MRKRINPTLKDSISLVDSKRYDEGAQDSHQECAHHLVRSDDNVFRRRAVLHEIRPLGQGLLHRTLGPHARVAPGAHVRLEASGILEEIDDRGSTIGPGVDTHADVGQGSVAVLCQELGKREELAPRRLVESAPCLVRFPKRVSLPREKTAAIGGTSGEKDAIVGGTAGAAGYAVLVVDVVPRNACVQEIYLVASGPNGVVLQHGCYGAIEAYAIRARCVEDLGLTGLEPEASDLGAFGSAAGCVAGKSARSVGVFHFVADALFGVVLDSNDGLRSTE